MIRMIDMGCMEKLTAIGEIGDRSGKEYQIEMQLKKMKEEWEEIIFDCEEPYRNTETYILKGNY